MRHLTSRGRVLGELLGYLWRHDRRWLIPLIVALFIFGIFVALSVTGILSPFLYSWS